MSIAAISKLSIKPIASPDRNPHATHLRLINGGKANKPEYQQAALALEFATTTAEPTLPITPAIIRLVHDAAWDEVSPEDEFFERQPTGTADLPPAAAWAQRFAQIINEVMGGQRPAKQVVKWVTPAVLSQLQPQRSGSGVTQQRIKRLTPSVVKRVRVDQPADGVAEVAAVVRDRHRARALTLRLEGWDGRWICTSAQWVG